LRLRIKLESKRDKSDINEGSDVLQLIETGEGKKF
jgi:hypothetical protein